MSLSKSDGGCGLAVKAPDCGSGYRGFESRQPPCRHFSSLAHLPARSGRTNRCPRCGELHHPPRIGFVYDPPVRLRRNMGKMAFARQGRSRPSSVQKLYNCVTPAAIRQVSSTICASPFPVPNSAFCIVRGVSSVRSSSRLGSVWTGTHKGKRIDKSNGEDGGS